MFKQEHWGKGYASEFASAFVRMWSGLPREEGVELMVDERTTRGDGTAEECLIAITAEENERSQGVLRKAGFERLMTWEVRNTTGNEFVGETIRLPVFQFFPGRVRQGQELAAGR